MEFAIKFKLCQQNYVSWAWGMVNNRVSQLAFALRVMVLLIKGTSKYPNQFLKSLIYLLNKYLLSRPIQKH